MTTQPVRIHVLDASTATVDGETIHAVDGKDIHTTAIHYVAQSHASHGPVAAVAEDAHGATPLTVHPDGTTTARDWQPEDDATSQETNNDDDATSQSEPHHGVETASAGSGRLDADTDEDATVRLDADPAPTSPPQDVQQAAPTAARLPQSPAMPPQSTPAPEQVEHGPVDTERISFIEPHRATPDKPKPATGFAGVLQQLGIGGPNAAQRAEEADRLAVSRVWTRPKTIAVANPKGGCAKTPTTICLAAMYARLGGGMVLAHDNNVTRGTLGWRTEQADHDATMADLRDAVSTFTGNERAAEMARFTHHQTDDRFDVLQSVPKKLATDQALTDEEFDEVQRILQRFYRLVIFDSGNDESARPWLSMIRHSNALVVPTSTAADRLATAELMLEELHAQGGHSADLARNAVVVISHASTNDPAPEAMATKFQSLAQTGFCRDVLTIPHDPAMAKAWLRWDDLAPKTQRAWLAVGAAVARGLED